MCKGDRIMIGKNTYIAMRKLSNASVTSENHLGKVMDGTAVFSVDAMVRVSELETDKSVLKIEGIIDFGIHGECVYVKLPGYPSIYSNSTQGSIKKEEWFHIGMTTDGSRVSLYLDGCYNCCVIGQMTGTNTGSVISIGTNFIGDMRYVRIFGECLDADTMKAIMYETDIEKIPFAWYDFTQNPAKERISGKTLSLAGAGIKTFTSAISLMGNSYLEVDQEELIDIRPGYYRTQQYSVQVHFKFETGEDNGASCYSILSDMAEGGIGGIHLYLKRMEDGFHLCFTHAFSSIRWNTVVSNSVIRQGIWKNAAVVFDVETAVIYIDGKEDCRKEGLLPAFHYDKDRMFLLGATRDDVLHSPKDYFAGCISQCDVWGRALSGEEVQRYINGGRDADAEEEPGFTLDLDGSGCFNGITYNGVALGNHAKVEEEISSAMQGAFETVFSGRCEEEPLAQSELSEIYKMCHRQWINHHTEQGMKCSPQMPYTVKAWKKEGMVYFVGCHNGKAYTVGTMEEKETTEEVIWWAELILMIIGGVCSAVFGLYIRTGSRAINKLLNIFYSNALLANALKSMTFGSISADTFLQLFSILYKENLLIKILKLVISGIAFWSLITLCAKFASWALGYGWAAVAVQLAALVVQVGLHIASYPNGDHTDDTTCVATLSEVQFSDIASSNMEGDFGYRANKTAIREAWISSYSIIKNTADKKLLSKWKMEERDSQTVAAYDLSNTGTTLVVAANFVLENTGNIDINVGIWGEGVFFYGMSDKKNILVPAKTIYPVMLDFRFTSYRMPSEVGEMEETISWKYECNGMLLRTESINVKLYFILSQPKNQWFDNPLWADALKYIIPKVQGESDIQGLYVRITRAINAEKQLAYTPESKYVKWYELIKCFDLSQFLSDMFHSEQSGAMESVYAVNCTDCAAVVMSFANMLGGNLYCERMSSKQKDISFLLKPIIPIGNSEISTKYSSFIYHETAMYHNSGNAEDLDNTTHKVYDASLEIETPSFGYIVSVGTSFSQYTDMQVKESLIYVQESDNSYRECLCPIEAAGVGSCYYDVQKGIDALPIIL